MPVDFSSANRALQVLLISPRSVGPGCSGGDAYTDNLLSTPPPGVHYSYYEDLIAAGEMQRISWGSQYARWAAAFAGGPIRLETLTADTSFDLIHIHAFSVRLTGSITRVPVLLSEGSHDLENLIAYGHWMRPAAERFARRKQLALRAIGAYDPTVNRRDSRRTIVWSEWARRMHVQWGTAEKDLVVIPPYVSPVSTALNPPVVVGVPPHYLFVGNDFVRKNGPLILDAFRRIRSRLPPGARLTIVGAPTEELNDPGAGITHMPLLPRGQLFSDVYPSANIFVLPSSAAGYGIALIEAMSAGIAPIVSGFGVLPEIVSDAGLVVDVAAGHTNESVANLADAMLRLGNDSVLRAVLGSRARDRYHIYGARSATLDPLAALYREAAEWEGVVA